MLWFIYISTIESNCSYSELYDGDHDVSYITVFLFKRIKEKYTINEDSTTQFLQIKFLSNTYTVKPVYKEHWGEPGDVPFITSCP
jgi:hypothetical protein